MLLEIARIAAIKKVMNQRVKTRSLFLHPGVK